MQKSVQIVCVKQIRANGFLIVTLQIEKPNIYNKILFVLFFCRLASLKRVGSNISLLDPFLTLFRLFRDLLDPCQERKRHIPVVQMALQTEKNDFQINYAFHSRYRYRQKILLEFILRSRYRHSCSLQFRGGRIADEKNFGHTQSRKCAINNSWTKNSAGLLG